MKKLKIWTIILHSFIVIIHKSTISVMFFIEFFIIQRWLANNGDFSDSFTSLMLTASIISALGKLLIITSFYVKKVVVKNLTGIIGLVLLYFSFRYVAYPSLPDTDFHKWAFWSGIPFIIASILLFYQQFTVLKNKFSKKKSEVTDV
ncbi:hypothetical protein [Dokdonia sp. Asnod1-B02]|uniref:hypothetical protein n=1 Tax=Dokdonia sp. Asnod1-B02 TaxID=3160573 RepID=UPI00386EDBFD